MKTLARTLIVSALVAATGVAGAGPRYYGPSHGHYHHHDGWGLGGLVLGLAVAVPLIALASQADRAPDVVYVQPPPAPLPPPPVVYAPQPVYAPSRPAPVIYPRNGQSNAQLEADNRECNRWATTQQAAMADASVFQRAVEACMDGRGYTLR
ncbi:MAG: hypothetical protein HY020_19360 [Burkholderiales bacterium]|nr:hypothetical protein [Burkholderiales bacterium]